MAEVYWIRKKEHTDIFTQGYVGVTKYTAEKRFAQHRERSVSSDLQNICKAIRKYGAENLIVDTVVISELGYCFDLEAKLRPTPFIGWNIAVGGTAPIVGYKPSEEKKKAHSERMKQWWIDNPDHDHSNKGRPGVSIDISPERRKKMVDSKFYNLPLKNFLWVEADIYYQSFLSGLTQAYAQKEYGLKAGQLACMWNRFKSGWVPNDDARWLEVVSKIKEA